MIEKRTSTCNPEIAIFCVFTHLKNFAFTYWSVLCCCFNVSNVFLRYIIHYNNYTIKELRGTLLAAY